jgi:hypothetical protein
VELATLAGILLLITLSFSDVLFLGRSFYNRDFSRLHVPDRKVLRDIVKSGEFPFWNPSYAAGQPFAANPSAEVFYPPQWLVLLPNFLRAVNLEVFLHYLFAATGMFVLLRSLRLHVAACAFGATSFALSGLLVSLSSLLPFFFAITWFPWVGHFTHRFLERRRIADFAFAAISLGMILLIGEPAMILQAGALVASYCAYRLRHIRGLAIAAAICATATLIGAAQIIPAIDHRRDSLRSGELGYDISTTWSLHPLRPLELAAPNLLGVIGETPLFWIRFYQNAPWVFSWYAGLLAAALIVAGFAHRLRGWMFVAAFVVVSYLIAIGRYGGVFRLLYACGLNFIRYPEKLFFGAAFLLIVFAAIAADLFIGDAAFRRTTFIIALGFVAVDLVVLLITYPPLFRLVWGSSNPELILTARGGAWMMLAASIALTLILALRHYFRLCIVLLTIFVIVDLAPRKRFLAPTIGADFYDPPPVARMLPPHARIYHDAIEQLSRMPNPPSLSGSARWLRAHNAMWPDMQRLFGIDAVLEKDVTLTNLGVEGAFANLFLVARFGGRGDLVPLLLTLAGATHVITLRDASSVTNPVSVVTLGNERYYFADMLVESGRIMERKRWPRRIAFVDAPFVSAAGRIISVHERSNTIDFDVSASGDAVLVISVTRHKYWQATIDDRPAQLFRANLGFQALTIPRGRHHVSMRYRNPLVVIFGIVSLTAAIALIIIAAIDAVLRSRESQPQSPH